jgi:hypothetical protein
MDLEICPSVEKDWRVVRAATPLGTNWLRGQMPRLGADLAHQFLQTYRVVMHFTRAYRQADMATDCGLAVSIRAPGSLPVEGLLYDGEWMRPLSNAEARGPGWMALWGDRTLNPDLAAALVGHPDEPNAPREVHLATLRAMRGRSEGEEKTALRWALERISKLEGRLDDIRARARL